MSLGHLPSVDADTAVLAFGMKTFGAVRPYPTRIRERVFRFLAQLGYQPGDGMILPPGTSNREAARWVERTPLDLLLLPFHLHRANDGTPLDGLAVAKMLPPGFEDRGTPILMPVTQFSWEGTFQGRLDTLLANRPRMSAVIVPMREADIGARAIAKRIQRIARTSGQADGLELSGLVEPPPTSGTFSTEAQRGPKSESPVSSQPFSYTRENYKNFLDELEKKHADKG